MGLIRKFVVFDKCILMGVYYGIVFVYIVEIVLVIRNRRILGLIIRFVFLLRG